MALDSALKEIRSLHVREDYAVRVKQVVHEYLRSLEPSAQIEDTRYFNHSAIPDFVATWNNQTREIFIRSSYAEIVAGDDTNYIRGGSPFFLALESTKDFDEPGFTMSALDAEAAVAEHDRTLLTDASALDALTEHSKDPAESPLSKLVQANFVRGAKGFVDGTVAEALVGGVGFASLGDAEKLITSRFSDDAVFRIQRTAALVRWATDADADEMTLRGAIDGHLSPEELRSVLPWLLRNSSTSDRRFWMQLGGLIGLEELEQIAPDLLDVDLTRLVQANLDRWGARRAVLTFDFGSSRDEREETAGAMWGFHNGVLGVSVGSYLVRVSETGTRLKARPGLAIPRWDEVQERFAAYNLSSVSLSGQARSFTLNANESPSVNRDVGSVTSTIQDDYVVDKARVALSAAGEDQPQGEADVDFGSGLIAGTALLQVGPLVSALLEIVAGVRTDRELAITEVEG